MEYSEKKLDFRLRSCEMKPQLKRLFFWDISFDSKNANKINHGACVIILSPYINVFVQNLRAIQKPQPLQGFSFDFVIF